MEISLSRLHLCHQMKYEFAFENYFRLFLAPCSDLNHKNTHRIWLTFSLVRSNINGCGMGPLLVRVSPCFRENVIVNDWVFFV